MNLTGQTNPFCPPVLEDCTDGTVATYNPNGETDLFWRWIGIEPARATVEQHAVIPYIGAEGIAAGAPTSGVPTDICCYGNGVEVGEPCYIRVDQFGTLKRRGDKILEGTNELPYCVTTPRMTVDNVAINDEEEWHEATVSNQILSDLFLQMLIGEGTQDKSGKPDHWGLIPLMDGTAETAGVYGCDWLTPHVLDWAGNAACSPTAQVGITLDGSPLSDKYNKSVYEALRGVYDAMSTLFKRMPVMNSAGINFGDIALIGDPSAFQCIAECQACAVRCDAGVTRIDNAAANEYYETLLKGGFGYGEVSFGNVRIPFIPYNPFNWTTGRGALTNADGSQNLMLMWRGSSSNRTVKLQYNPLQETRRKVTRDNGLFQIGYDNEEDCDFMSIMAQWRWRMNNPCLQTLIKNFSCEKIELCEPDFTTVTAIDPCLAGDCP